MTPPERRRLGGWCGGVLAAAFPEAPGRRLISRRGRRRSLDFLAMLFFAASLHAAPRERLASLLPWITDAFMRVPERVEVVASVSDPSFPTPKGVLDLGNPHSPSFEILASARPTIVIGDRRIHGVIREKLARSGARIVFVEGSRR
jgi:hypothetical protein